MTSKNLVKIAIIRKKLALENEEISRKKVRGIPFSEISQNIVQSRDNNKKSVAQVLGSKNSNEPSGFHEVKKLMKQKIVPADPSELRLFVKNLRPETTKETLKQYFDRWGVVIDVFMRQSEQNNYDGTRCSMGYITFSCFYNQSPLSVIHIIDGMSVAISKVKVTSNPKYETVEKSRTIMISGTIQELKDHQLIEYFINFGKVIKLNRKRDPQAPGKYVRFAFICFRDTKAADKVLQRTAHVIKGQVVDARRVKDQI